MIEKVDLLDENNNKSEILMSGHPADIKVRLKGHETMDDLTLGIAIRDRFGQDIYGTNSYYLNKNICIKPDQTLDVTYAFEQFNLGPGKYSITIALHKGPSHVDECIHWIDGCAVFEVVAGDHHYFSGLARLTPDLHVKQG